MAWSITAGAALAQSSLAPLVDRVQPKIAKIYGAGRIAGLEGYQSGVIISSEGHILTAWSHVLDTDGLIVILHDGRRYKATMLGADPRIDVAVLKIDAQRLQFFDLEESHEAFVGSRVLAFSNLFGIATGDEQASVLHGRVSSVAPLQARAGPFPTLYRGQVYIVDAMTNNPGAAGGALVNLRGELLGMLGKDVRSSVNDLYLNYAMPIDQLRESVHKILAGETLVADEEVERELPEASLSLEELGILLMPDVLTRTPPFVDAVIAGSPAAVAGLAPDDLVVFLDSRLIQSNKDLKAELTYIPKGTPVSLTVIRNQVLVEVILRSAIEP